MKRIELIAVLMLATLLADSTYHSHAQGSTR
jgi:hypothetical protein